MFSDNDDIEVPSLAHSEISITDKDPSQISLSVWYRKPLYAIILCIILSVFLMIGITYFSYPKQSIDPSVPEKEAGLVQSIDPSLTGADDSPTQVESEQYKAGGVSFPMNIGRYNRKNVDTECGLACADRVYRVNVEYRSPNDVVIVALGEMTEKSLDEYVEARRFSPDGVKQSGFGFERRISKGTIINFISAVGHGGDEHNSITMENEVVAYFLKNYPSFDNKTSEAGSFFPEKIEGFTLVKSRTRVLPRCPVLMDMISIQPCRSSMEVVYQNDTNKLLGIFVGFIESEDPESIEKIKSAYFDGVTKISISRGKLIIPSPPIEKYGAILVGAIVIYSDTSEIDDVEMLYENNSVLKYFTEKYSSK